LLGPLKKHLLGWHFTSDEEVYHQVPSCFMGLDMNFSSSGMGNLVKNWDKCLNKYDDYVEKYLMYMRFFLCIFTLF
jgi:hypothetical protein